jgi:hypothetical protein
MSKIVAQPINAKEPDSPFCAKSGPCKMGLFQSKRNVTTSRRSLAIYN